jgi:hypothetical protein
MSAVPITGDSLCNSEVFILDTGPNVYQWDGETAGIFLKNKVLMHFPPNYLYFYVLLSILVVVAVVVVVCCCCCCPYSDLCSHLGELVSENAEGRTTRKI